MEMDGFRGQLITADYADYDTARAVWNGAVDRRPRLIARCSGTADVAAAPAPATTWFRVRSALFFSSSTAVDACTVARSETFAAWRVIASCCSVGTSPMGRAAGSSCGR